MPVGAASPKKFLADEHPIEDIHAANLTGLGIDAGHEVDTPVGRPLKLSDGSPIKRLFTS